MTSTHDDDSDEAQVAERASAPDKQVAGEEAAHLQHDLAQPPGRFAEPADQATSGEGAVTARTTPGDTGDIPTAIAAPVDPPDHEKGRHAA
ncbi:hypothetical protein Cme02nite_28220 [Catellatospora methionotrophica]|uniref:Uncharacterized protein n=1 Tax=Catellatospora methionotrophica TaxID=121620 RepID=A0A8J3LKN5_9ACTN|nr:hypothetical protein [Catellatospora methionotrophica]GIG14490.1 hypothetical protein Cme02nite_28220 [Catellatospora methionotrophica]